MRSAKVKWPLGGFWGLVVPEVRKGRQQIFILSVEDGRRVVCVQAPFMR